MTDQTVADRHVRLDAMHHLGNVLYLLADLHPDYRCKALDDALAFYNLHCPARRVAPSGIKMQKLVDYL